MASAWAAVASVEARSSALIRCVSPSSQPCASRCKKPTAATKCNSSSSSWDPRSQKRSSRTSRRQHGICTLASMPLLHHSCRKDVVCSSSSSFAPTFGEGTRLGSGAVAPGNCGRRRHKKATYGRPKAQDDDFEIDEDRDFDMDMEDFEEDEEEDFRDYETEYDSPVGYRSTQGETDTFMNTEGEEEETVVGWKINEEEFHKFKMFTCDFFIRKVPDPDNDVFDFREMYVTPTDTDVYSIPKVVGTLPKKPVRCSSSNWEYIHTTEPPVDQPRSPLHKTDMEVMKVILIKHLKDRPAKHEGFILDFEEVYVIDCKTKSFTKVDVKVDVRGGKNRNRNKEVLIVGDDGTTFCIIPEEEQRSPDEIIQTLQWDRTREAMENYLRGFRDYEISNWF